ncbi:hypothetical protein C8N43_0307 [Litoreibacter ponti]|uniref:Response regulator receiver domain-containing protein n=1 Tax=Litoreibacter ponti TaxID=1510457 RepID=A0A2T6BHY0_9RHOB|nr:response regulator transcription factor [Litoreibacter ponti]PTX55667.1 hypothetical protein C8N43_0307 [Litoreibacter ponti]
MHALILSDDPNIHHHLTDVLAKQGFTVINSESVMMAQAHARAWIFDLIVMTERVGGRLTHAVALSAEKRAPFVKTVILTDRTDADVDELYDLLPSLAGMASPTLSAQLISQIALASVTGSARAAKKIDFDDAPLFASRRLAEPEPAALAS